MERLSTGRFSYVAEGDPSAPPVVFLHGIAGAGRAFRAQLTALAPRRRAIGLDLPGYGGSAALPEITIPALAEALADFIRELRLDCPVLVGHSIGGMAVQELLAREPRAARAAVLFQTSAAFGSRDPAWGEAFVRARLDPLDRGETLADLAEGMVAGLVGEDADAAGLTLARDCVASVPEATFRGAVRALVGFDRRADLGALSVPTLVLAGERDTNAPHEAMRRMADRIPGAEFACIPGAGHLAGLERPDAVNAALLDFLDRRAPVDGPPAGDAR